MNEIFVDARMRDWNETAEAIAFERRVRRILADASETSRRETAIEATRTTTSRRAA